MDPGASSNVWGIRTVSDFIAFLEEPEAGDPDLIGREAQQLHLLSENAVLVPEGFLVTSTALRNFLDSTGVGERINRLLTADGVGDKGLEILSREAVETVMGADVSWDLESELIGGYEHLARAMEVDFPKVTVVASVAFHPERFPYFANTFERRVEVHDRHDLERALREAWASLFTMDSLEYFDSLGWDVEDIKASVMVQRALEMETSGVAVPLLDDKGDQLVIKSVLGHGSSLEGGVMEPETCFVDLERGQLLERVTREQTSFLYPDDAGRLRPIPLTPDLASEPKVPEEACAELARLSRLANKVFSEPMVLEWAIEKDRVFIVNVIPMSALEALEEEPEEAEEAVPEVPAIRVAEPTPVPQEPVPPVETPAPPSEADVAVLEALQSIGFASKREVAEAMADTGKAPEDIPEAEDVPEPEEAVEEEPVVTAEEEEEVLAEEEEAEEVIEEEAEEIAEEEEEVLAEEDEAEEVVAEEVEEVPEEEDATEAEGIVEPSLEEAEGPPEPVEVALEAPEPFPEHDLLSPEELDLGPYLPITEMQVLVNTTRVESLKGLPGVPVTGVRFDDGNYLVDLHEGIHPLRVQATNPDRFVETLAAGQVAIAREVFPQPVYIQFTDLRSDVFRDLEGGEEFAEKEGIPSMGFRGASKLLSEKGQPLLRAEAQAFRRARKDGSMTNLHLVIPYPRTVDEVEAIYNVLFEEGVRRSGNLRIFIDVSVPSTLLFLHLYSQVSDGFFVRLDELLPALLSVDPSSEALAELRYTTADEKAVRQAILLVTEAARQAKKDVIMETCRPLDPSLVEFLLTIGISGICLSHDGLRENVALISKIERSLQSEE
jgi:pyruvate,water dikinase